jgi:hypothetical protein
MEAYPMSVDFNLRALKTTDAELTLIASAAIKGDRRCPVSGYSSPLLADSHRVVEERKGEVLPHVFHGCH